MRQYETIVIFRADAPTELIEKIGKNIEKTVKKKPGKFIERKDWGTKRLSYEIEKEKQGKYISWVYEQDGTAPLAVDKHLRFEEDLLRYATYIHEEKKRVQLEDEEKAKKTKSDEQSDNKYKPLPLDYRKPMSLSRFITEKGKIIPARVSGVSKQKQNLITREIKRARQLALLSYTSNFIGDRPERTERNKDRDHSSSERNA